MGNRTEDASWSENVKNVEMTFPPAGFVFCFVFVLLFVCLFVVVVLVCLFFISIYHTKARRPVIYRSAFRPWTGRAKKRVAFEGEI